MVVTFRSGWALLACSALFVAPTPVPAKSVNLGTIGCVVNGDQGNRPSTEMLLGWLASYAAGWNPKNDYSIAAIGGQSRLFTPQGRSIHPRELADMISRSPTFTGKKRESVWLAVSDAKLGGDKSYANKLAALLGTKVTACSADAYIGPRGLMMCGSRGVFDLAPGSNPGRSMPLGFALGDAGFMMLFCIQKGTGIDPQSMLSSGVAFGLYDDEIADLTERAESNRDAAFRLYQYFWISRRETATAMVWLERAAKQGHSIARFNLAYELLESGDPASRVRAEVLIAELAAEGFAAPDLRAYFQVT